MDFDDDHWTTDPRPDLPGSDVYEGLFVLEYPVSGHSKDGLYGTLRGLRCIGAGIKVAASGAVKLAPPPDMDASTFREFLAEHRDHLADLMTRLDKPQIMTMPRRRAVLLSKEV